MNIFEKASKLKLRFEGGRGEFSVEDVWELSLQSLNTLAKAVNKKIQSEDEESFIPTNVRKAVTHNNLRLEILKHIIAVKVAEADAAKTRAEKADKTARLRELIASKQDEALKNKSLDELLAELTAEEASLEATA